MSGDAWVVRTGKERGEGSYLATRALEATRIDVVMVDKQRDARRFYSATEAQMWAYLARGRVVKLRPKTTANALPLPVTAIVTAADYKQKLLRLGWPESTVVEMKNGRFAVSLPARSLVVISEGTSGGER